MLVFSFLISILFQASAAPFSFVEMARHNPKAFIKLVDSASPDAVGNIITILDGMIITANSQINDADDQLEAAYQSWTNAQSELDSQTKECIDTSLALSAAESTRDVAAGASTQANSTKTQREPQLVEELLTLNDVRTKIESLGTSTYSGDNSRRLLALGTEVTLTSIKRNPKSLLEMVANADPIIVSEVIDLIDSLIIQAETEKNQINTEYDNALLAYLRALASYDAALAQDTDCISNQNAKQQEEQVLAGTYQAELVVHQARVA